jgi:hypothetical protein
MSVFGSYSEICEDMSFLVLFGRLKVWLMQKITITTCDFSYQCGDDVDPLLFIFLSISLNVV